MLRRVLLLGSRWIIEDAPLEIDSSMHNYAGTLGMARGQDVNSGTSQFCINTADNTSLDGNYTVFVKVIARMPPVTIMSKLPVNSNERPLNPLPFLTNVTISNSAREHHNRRKLSRLRSNLSYSETSLNIVPVPSFTRLFSPTSTVPSTFWNSFPS